MGAAISSVVFPLILSSSQGDCLPGCFLKYCGGKKQVRSREGFVRCAAKQEGTLFHVPLSIRAHGAWCCPKALPVWCGKLGRGRRD